MAQLLDGKVLASRIKQSLKEEAAQLKKETGRAVRVMNVMIGDDPAAKAYAASQKKAAKEIGVDYQLQQFPSDIIQNKLLEYIAQLNQDRAVHGIMVYKPVPRHIDYRAVTNSVAAHKDLEGTGLANIGGLILGEAKIIPCTAAAAMELIKSTQVNARGKEAVVVGRSEIVGKPVSLLLLAQSATVTICHSGTHEAGELKNHVGRADILVVAVGKAEFVKGDWIKKGAIVVDVGINKVGSRMVGDVEFEPAFKKASYITPVPGGVGPVTVVMLMKNALEAFKLQMKAAA